MSNHSVTPGARVGAISHADDNTVYLFGFGTYEGEFVPQDLTTELGKLLQDADVPNPRIKLDSGQTVWGCECWWGSEEKITNIIGTREIVHVDIDDVRASVKEGTDYLPNQDVVLAQGNDGPIVGPQDPELVTVISDIEGEYPELEPVKHIISDLLHKYIGVLTKTSVLGVAHDLLLELIVLKSKGTIAGLTSFSVDVYETELEVNLGIIFSDEKQASITYAMQLSEEKSDILDS
jgi:hypothetical protein